MPQMVVLFYNHYITGLNKTTCTLIHRNLAFSLLSATVALAQIWPTLIVKQDHTIKDLGILSQMTYIFPIILGMFLELVRDSLGVSLDILCTLILCWPYLSVVWSRIEYGTQLWCSYLRKDILFLESSQRSFIKQFFGMQEDLDYRARLDHGFLYSL